MSYYDEPDDDYMTPEQALDSGWLDPDELEVLRALLKRAVLDPKAGDINTAVLIMLDNQLNAPPANSPDDPYVVWARHMLEQPITAQGSDHPPTGTLGSAPPSPPAGSPEAR